MIEFSNHIQPQFWLLFQFYSAQLWLIKVGWLEGTFQTFLIDYFSNIYHGLKESHKLKKWSLEKGKQLKLTPKAVYLSGYEESCWKNYHWWGCWDEGLLIRWSDELMEDSQQEGWNEMGRNDKNPREMHLSAEIYLELT